MYKKIIILSCVILSLIWGIYFKIGQRSEYKKLQASHSFAIGMIERISSKQKTWRNYYCYYFFVVGKDTVRHYVIKYLNDERSEFLGNIQFPVAFEKGNPKNNEMLIFKDDFENYELSYPDSLKILYEQSKKEGIKNI